MPRCRPRAGDREESTVAENPSKLAFKVHALRVARKLEREEQRRALPAERIQGHLGSLGKN